MQIGADAQYGTPLKKVKLHKSNEDLLDDVQQYSTMFSHVEQLACFPYDLPTSSSRPAEVVSYLTSLEVLAVECDFVSTTVLSSILYAVAAVEQYQTSLHGRQAAHW